MIPLRPVRIARIAAHISEAAWKLTFHAPRWSAARRRAETARWSRRAMTLIGADLRIDGAAHPGGQVGTLYVANHVSWMDICALLASRDLCFVAKADIRDWPVIGRIATQAGTLYVERERRAATRAVNADIIRRLEAGQSVCIFPEGTTTEGDALLPFRSALFESATAVGADIQPVAIRHVDAAGNRLDDAAFVGDTSLVRSIWRLLGARGTRTELTFLPVFSAARMSRRDAALQAERAIAQSLGVAVKERPLPSIAPRATGDEVFDFAPG